MKRVIEFRGRRIDNNEWVYGDLETRRASGRTFIHTYNEDGTYNKQYEVDPDTVGQFTGLLDKNGKEIYEGDIIRIKEPNGMYSEAELQFCERGYWAINHGINDRVIAGFVDKKQIEVVGNIHDNPELLNAER